MVIFFRLTCSIVLWGGRNTANKYHWCVWGLLAVSWPHWDCPYSLCVCFHSIHFSGSRLICLEMSEASPGLHALPRSKPLRFRFSGTPQRRRLGWACILCPSQVQAVQVLGERSHPQLGAPSYCLPCPSGLVFWVYNRRAFSGVPCVSPGELISGCDLSGRC